MSRSGPHDSLRRVKSQPLTHHCTASLRTIFVARHIYNPSQHTTVRSIVSHRPHTNVNDVALLQLTLIRDTVADHLIDGPANDRCERDVGRNKWLDNLRADRFGEVAVVQRGRIGSTLDCRIVDDSINLICGNSRSYGRGSDVQNLPRQLHGAEANTGCGQNGTMGHGADGALESETSRRRRRAHLAYRAHFFLLLGGKDFWRLTSASVLGRRNAWGRGERYSEHDRLTSHEEQHIGRV